MRKSVVFDAIANVCGFCVIALMCTIWWEFSRIRYIAPIAGLGLFATWSQAKPTKHDLKLYISFFLFHSVILISVAAYGSIQSIFFQIGIVSVVFPFLHTFVTRYGLNYTILYACSISALPTLLPNHFGNETAMSIYNIKNAGEWSGRFLGLVNDANYASLYLICPLIGSLFLTMRGWRLNKVFWGIIVFIILFAIFATGSRAGIAAAVCAIAMFFFLAVPNKRVYLRGTILIFSTLILIVAPMVIAYAQFFYNLRLDGSVSNLFQDSRFDVWSAALQDIIFSFPINSVDEQTIINKYGIVVHNFLLDIGLSYGSLPMLLHFIFWALSFIIFVNLIKSARLKDEHQIQEFYVYYFSLVIPMLMISFTITVGTGTIYWFFYILAWAVIFEKKSRIAFREKAGRC